MSDNRRVFFLSDILLREDWTTSNSLNYAPTAIPGATPSTMDSPNFGYFIGGATPGPTSKVDKISYVTDSTARAPSTNLLAIRSDGAATSDSSSTYLAGGNNAGFAPLSSTEKINYIVELLSAAPSANLSAVRYGHAATGNSSVGYFGAGVTGSPGIFASSIEKITYSTDVRTNISAGLELGRYYLAATGSSTAGYFTGGSPYYSTVNKLTYSTETSSNIPGTLTNERYSLAATGSSTAGYFGGGTPSPGVTNRSTVDKLTYSTDTVAASPGSNLSNTVRSHAATGRSSTAGYFAGGQISPSSSIITTTDKIDYSTDTRTTVPSAFLSETTQTHSAASARANVLPETMPLVYAVPNNHYISGGNGQGIAFDKVIHSTDTVDRIPSITNIFDNAGASSPTNAYFGGFLSFTKLNYSTETSSIINATLSLNRTNLNATASPSVGYFRGGAPLNSTTDKLTFATDTRTTVPGSFLINSRFGMGSAGNKTTGYYAGGAAGTVTSVSELITYSSDTVSAITGLPGFARYYLAATGNSTAGYFAGGFLGPAAPNLGTSRVEKLTYSSNTFATLPAAPLPLSVGYHAASGNSSSGYFSGGTSQAASPIPNANTLISKLSYSTDTISTTTNLRLPNTRGNTATYATGALSDALPFTQPGLAPTPAPTEPPDAGYFAGGYNPNQFSTIQKVNFAVDTQSTSGFLPFTRFYIAATSSLTAGYFSGGQPGFTTVDKITYSTDSVQTVFSSFLPSFEIQHAGTGNSLAGYFTGGSVSVSNTDKITYSTEISSVVPSAILNPGRFNHAAAGNSSAGYFTGGLTSPGGLLLSTTDKLNYSTETISTLPGAALPNTIYVHGASGNASESYFAGGFSSSYLSIAQRLTYSTETTALVPGAFLVIPRSSNATGNTLNGYFGGGQTSPSTYASSIDKINYSTDTRTQVTTATLTARGYMGAASGRDNGLYGQTVQSIETQNTGYFGGGAIPGVSSTVDKISLAVDTTAAVPSAFLSAGRSGLAATGNQTAGYFGGGSVPGLSSTMEKINYSLDTDSLVPGAALSSARTSLSATDGNAIAGYFGGGIITGPAIVSTTDKLTYSTETTAAVAPAALSSTRSNLAAAGNSTAGYFAGGSSPAIVSTTDKLTYATDTRTTVPGAFLISPRSNLAATGSSTLGYFGGGVIAGPALVSTVDKLAYSNDTISTVPGAALSSARSNLSATGNSTSGYFGGGIVPAIVSTMDKITFATDTRQIIPAAVLSSPRSELGATGARANGLTTTLPVIV